MSHRIGKQHARNVANRKKQSKAPTNLWLFASGLKLKVDREPARRWNRNGELINT
jgi:hypothetical protein